MAAVGDDDRPVFVRVRRKASQYRLDALWLQINDGPFKREFLDFGKLSISDSSATDGLEINERSLKRALLDFGKLSISESSSTSTVYGGSLNDDERPVVVGDKRKASQSRHDGIEISEIPLKKTFFNLGKLSVSETSDSIVDELKTRKVLLCHVKTVTNSEMTFDVLQPEVPASADASKFKNKSKEIWDTFKAKDKHDRLLAAKAKQSQEFVSKNARFIQIWRSRKSKKEAMHEESLHDKCQFYDIVRVDFEETNQEMLNDHKRGSELDNHKLMSRYLPLLKEILPSAAMEIESNISISRLAQLDGFVYDIYAVNDEMNTSELDVGQTFPLVQVDADDSNAEKNPLNEHPDTELSGETNEADTSSKVQPETDWRSSNDQSGGAENTNHQSSEPADNGRHGFINANYVTSDYESDDDDDEPWDHGRHDSMDGNYVISDYEGGDGDDDDEDWE